MNIDLAREYIVIVNGGSGVIIQPMTQKYLYVLTVKHNFSTAHKLEQLIRFKFENGNWQQIPIQLSNFKEGEQYFPHPEKDIAIIKIPPCDGFDKAFKFTKIDEEKTDFHLLGYPEIRRKNQPNCAEWYRIDNEITLMDPRSIDSYEAEIPGNPALNEVRGDSGGGIVKIVDGSLFVAGIQNRMAEEEEQLGRIRFTPISLFNEIIANFSDKLEPILPYYLISFQFLESGTFNIEAAITKRETGETLTAILKQEAKNIISSDITPNVIKTHFEERLLLIIDKQENTDLEKREIWSAWLEFLTVLNVYQNKKICFEDLKALFMKIRFFYSDINEDFWINHLDDLNRIDYQGLEEKGIVIVSSNKPAYGGVHILNPDDIPGDITRLRKQHDLSMMSIDEPTDFPFDKYKFVNLSAFKEGILVDLSPDFQTISIPECVTILKTLYERLFINN